MKIIKDNRNKQLSDECTCQNCGSILLIDDDDIYKDEFNDSYWKCPLCSERNYIEEPVVTIETIEYPKSFNNFLSISKGGTAVEIGKEEINKWVKECLEFLRDNPDEPFKYIASGNTTVIAFRHDGDEEYYVIVSNDYYDCYIPFEDEDYE